MTRYRIGTLEFHSATRVLYFEGAILPLAPKAADLLALLLENAGEVVSRETIRQKVWDGSYIEEGNITKHIALLRSTLRPYVETDPIRTVPKRGYQFEGPATVIKDAEPEPELAPTAAALAVPPPPPTRLLDRPATLWVLAGCIALISATALYINHTHQPAVPLVAASSVPPGLAIPNTPLNPLPTNLPRPTLAVLTPANLSGPSAAWYAASIRELLAADLPTADNFRAISDERSTVAEQDLSLPAASYDTATLHRVGRRLRCNYAVITTYKANNAGSLALTLDLRRTDTGDSLHRVDKTVRRDDLIPALAEAATAFRAALSIPTPKLSATDILPLDRGLDSLRPYADGLHALRLFRLASAQKQLALAAKLSPHSSLVHVALSRTYAVIGSEDLAGSEAHLALTNASGLPVEQRLSVQAHAYSLLNDWPSAIAAYHMLARLRPDNLDYTLAHANVLYRSGDPKAALAILRAAGASREAAMDPQLDHEVARSYSYLEDYPSQLAAAETEVRHARAAEAYSLVSDGLIYQGMALSKLNEPERARAVFTEAESLSAHFHDPWGQSRALDRLGRIQYSLHEPAAAETYRKMLATDEQMGWSAGMVTALSALARVQRSQHEDNEARASLVRASDLASALHNNASQAEVLDNLMETSSADLAARAGYAQRALALGRASGREYLVAHAQTVLGDIAVAQKNSAAAHEHYTRAVDYYADHHDEANLRHVLQALIRLDTDNPAATSKWQNMLSANQPVRLPAPR